MIGEIEKTHTTGVLHGMIRIIWLFTGPKLDRGQWLPLLMFVGEKRMIQECNCLPLVCRGGKLLYCSSFFFLFGKGWSYKWWCKYSYRRGWKCILMCNTSCSKKKRNSTRNFVNQYKQADKCQELERHLFLSGLIRTISLVTHGACICHADTCKLHWNLLISSVSFNKDKEITKFLQWRILRNVRQNGSSIDHTLLLSSVQIKWFPSALFDTDRSVTVQVIASERPWFKKKPKEYILFR